MKKSLFFALCLLLSFCVTLMADEKKDKEKDDKAKREREKERERALRPKDIKMVTLPVYKCEDNHVSGDYESGVCQEWMEGPGGDVAICRKKLSLAPEKMRPHWRGNSLVVVGEVSTKLPEGMRLELSVRFFQPGSTPFAWKEIDVDGPERKGFRKFEVTFNFPKNQMVEIVNDKGRLQKFSFSTEILNGEYWVEARFVKTKQSRHVRAKLEELQQEIPDFRCMDCKKAIMQPKFVKCPKCNQKLTKPVTLYPEVEVDKDGNKTYKGKLRTAFVCRKCEEEVPIEATDECPYCKSKNLLPTGKRDRQMFEEGLFKAYVPRPNYDDSVPTEVKNFEKEREEVINRFRKHYADTINGAMKLYNDLKTNYAAAYKSAFIQNGKFDREGWKKWLFTDLFPRIKPDSGDGRRLEKEIFENSKYVSSDQFKKESWNNYIRDTFIPAMSELVFKHFSFKQGFVVMPYGQSYTYLSQLLLTILKTGALNYTSSLYSANKIEPDKEDLVVLPANPFGVDAGDDPRVLNSLFRKIDQELGILGMLK